MKNEMCGIFGIGCNSVETLLLVFPNEGAAKSYVGDDVKEWKLSEGVPNYPMAELDFDNYEDGNIKGNNEVLKKYFKNGEYYGGCGGIYGLQIRPVNFATPVIHWDLD
jgi:hypothetical protein